MGGSERPVVLTLDSLRARWVEVLDDLERSHRTAWLALFDARLASLEAGVLTLDFSDATKFAGVHGYERDTHPEFLDQLAEAVEAVTGQPLRITGQVVDEG